MKEIKELKKLDLKINSFIKELNELNSKFRKVDENISNVESKYLSELDILNNKIFELFNK